VKLAEVFDQPEKIKWKKKGSSDVGSFIIEDNEYELFMNPYRDDDKTWSIEFVQVANDSFARRGKTGITGAGNEVKLFSTVIAGIKQWVKKNKPEVIEFTASEPSRKKLYNSLIKRLSKEIGYEIPDKELDNQRKNGDYRLERVK
tara:strand:+ start:4949 stop:5383 length:435 start_codon:yes stop_codon:yes gene_type:complete